MIIKHRGRLIRGDQKQYKVSTEQKYPENKNGKKNNSMDISIDK